ncbi:MAG: hypothetical protein LQ338_001504 [Usnochroma carphineum]|nr:MAG: hypothetical protein LQ338_001504 [Usnochroma carphineum]
MLKTKRRRIFKQQGVFSATTELQATEEELEDAQQNLERLPTQMAEQDQMMRSEADVQLLAAALDGFGQLATLAVEAAVVQDPGEYVASSAAREWHPVWIRAAQVYRTVTLAIARSNVTVDSLQIYEHSKRCSVPTWNVKEHIAALDTANFAQAATHLQSLSLSVSTKVETDYQKAADARAKLSVVDRANFEVQTQRFEFAECHTGRQLGSRVSLQLEGLYPGRVRTASKFLNLDLHLHHMGMAVIPYKPL